MVKVIPTKRPQLEGGNPFSFKTKTHFDEKKKFAVLGADDKLQQDIAVSTIRAHLEQFSLYPCEVSVTISVGSGTSEFNGEVKPYEGKSLIQSDRIIDRLQNLILNFIARHPKSSFNLVFNQDVEIVEVFKRS